MLEPFLHPRAGQALNALAGVLCVLLAFGDAGVTSAAGYVPSFVIMPILAVAFLLRAVGVQAGLWRDLGMMPWGYRASSWGAFALAWLVLGVVTTPLGALVLLAGVGLDAAAALSERRPGAARVLAGRLDGAFAWARRRALWIGVGWIAGLVVLHLFVAATLSWGPLLDWAYVVVGFALLLRFAAVGAREPDAAAFPPAPHRVHVAAARPVADPVAREAAEACDAFLQEGDAGPLLAVVRAAASHAHLDAPEVAKLEERVFAALARAGTSRVDDLDAAIAALEGGLPITTRRPA